MGKKTAVVAGHICIDITPVFPHRPASEVSSVLTPGRLLHMDGVDVHTGGAVANTGLAMKLLGCDVRLMGKVGNDDFGRLVQNALAQYDAAGDLIASPEATTSYSVVLAIPGIDRIFLHDPGANDTFTLADLNPARLSDAALFHFGYPPLMKQMYRDDGAELERLLQSVRAAGPVTSLDMAAVDPDSEAGRVNWYRLLERVLPQVDFFVPSAEELCFMLDRSRYADWHRRTGGGDVTEGLTAADIAPLGAEALKLEARVVLIKCGSVGMYYRTAGREVLAPLCDRLGLDPAEWADREGFQPSFRPDAIRSGTGAGDASIAAFLCSVLEGASLREAVELAAATGACCVSSYDALSGLVPLSELRRRIARGWETNS